MKLTACSICTAIHAAAGTLGHLEVWKAISSNTSSLSSLVSLVSSSLTTLRGDKDHWRRPPPLSRLWTVTIQMPNVARHANERHLNDVRIATLKIRIDYSVHFLWSSKHIFNFLRFVIQKLRVL